MVKNTAQLELNVMINIQFWQEYGETNTILSTSGNINPLRIHKNISGKQFSNIC